jgi:hypothetical protein
MRVLASDGLGTQRYCDPADMERTNWEDASEEPSDLSCAFDFDPEEMERLMRWQNLGVRYDRVFLS